MTPQVLGHIQGGDWWLLLLHFLSLSLLAIGGAITTAPEMQRYMVQDQHWLTDAEFNSSIALAQAAPGPNVLFIAVLGWNFGLNAAATAAPLWLQWTWGLAGVTVAMVGILVPSTTLTFALARWGHRNRNLRAVRAFKQGMAPIVVALLVATGWLMTMGHGDLVQNWKLAVLTLVIALVVWRTKIHLLWLLAGGALLGWLGWV
ncbi:MAG: chromate transporter [Rhodoferax sp.]|nr:MAG: chromate transporter [Rhodoferax sp.]